MAFVCHTAANHTNPIDNIAAYPDPRAAYNRHIGALLLLEAELLHAFHEALASGGVVQAPRHPEDWRDRAVPATQGVAQQCVRQIFEMRCPTINRTGGSGGSSPRPPEARNFCNGYLVAHRRVHFRV